MSELPILENAWVLFENDKISSFGTMDQLPTGEFKEIDAKGRMVFPAWCDSHTHIVYAGSREGEFVDRINGLSYEEIAERGGGILNSANRLHDATEDELFEAANVRLTEMMKQGTGAVEIKSGYGLTVEDEVKMLRVVKRLKQTSPVQIKATFLGAHAFPTKYKSNRAEYIRLITDEMLPLIVEEKLADYIDVFCDKGFFTPEETDIILKAGIKAGLRAKIHANELDYSGGIQVGVANNALSVDHLEFTGDEEIAVLKDSGTMPTILPSTAFFLGLPYAPARAMIDAGLPVALATDYNPGSSPSGRMPLIISLACIKMKMRPVEAIRAATLNSAYAMDLSNELGSITPGKIANLFVSSAKPGLDFIPYAFGSDHVDMLILNGKVIFGS